MTICRHQNVRLAITMLVTIFVDYIAIILGLLSAYHLRISLSLIEVSPHFKLEGIYTFIIVPIVFLVTLYLNGSYQIDKPYWDKVKTVFRSVTIGVIAAIVLMYTGHVTNDVSRLFVGFSYIFIMLFITAFRFISHKILNALQILYIPVLLVGAGKTAELVNKSLQRMPVSYYKIIGYVDDNPKSASIAKEYPCLGTFNDVENVIKDTGIQTVLICAPGLESKKLVALINRLQLLVKRVAFVPELFGLPTSNITARGMMEEQAVILRVQNNLARKSNLLYLVTSALDKGVKSSHAINFDLWCLMHKKHWRYI